MERVDRQEKPDLAWEAMVARTRERLYRAARFRTDATADAEDVVQEVYLRAWQGRRALSEAEDPDAWLFGILVNVVRNARRKRVRWGRVRERLRETDPAGPPEGGSGGDLWAAMKRLDEDDRGVLYLLHVEEMSYRSIASALGLGEGAVRTRVCRARQRLRKELHGKEMRS